MRERGIMNGAKQLPEICNPKFWEFYDEFCGENHIKTLVEKGVTELSSKMCNIMESTHRTRNIHRMSRPERGWMNHKAWLAIRTASVRNDAGDISVRIRAGDVVIVETSRDRDVIITHVPIIRHMVSGYLLSGAYPEMVGLFMPLFDKKTIRTCIEIRVARNIHDAISLADEEAKDWCWY